MRRLFLRKLKTELKIPVLALVDSDPYGLKILSVYMKGGGICWNAGSRSLYMLFSVQLLYSIPASTEALLPACRRVNEHVV